MLSRRRSSIARSATRFGIILVILASGPAGSAHQLDEYLQAAQVSIDHDRITLDLYLTPGVAVAASIIDAIDKNHDGAISSEEATQYATLTLGQCALSLDGSHLAMKLVGDDYPSTDDMRKGLGTIHLQATTGMVASGSGSHVVTFENHIDPRRSVYLANAMLPRDPRITVRKQERDARQSRLAISYDVAAPESKSSLIAWFLMGAAAIGISLVALVYRHKLSK